MCTTSKISTRCARIFANDSWDQCNLAYGHNKQKRDELAYHLTEHLRMNGVYWGLTALALMNKTDALPREAMIDWVMSCWDEEVGAFQDHFTR